MAKLGSFVSTLKALDNAWGIGTGPGFDGICYIAQKNYVDNRDHTIRISGIKSGAFDFTVDDVRTVRLLASANDWVKYEIRFKNCKVFFATLYTKSNDKNLLFFNSGWINFEWWLKDKIYKGDAAPVATGSVAAATDDFGDLMTPTFGEGPSPVGMEQEETMPDDEEPIAPAKQKKEKTKKVKKELTEEEKAARKKRNTLIAILVPLCVVMAAMAVLLPLYFTANLHFAYADGAIYLFDRDSDNGCLKLTGCSKKSGSLILPQKILGQEYYLGFCAFRGCSELTSVTIPEGVTSIGSGAFSNCSGLTSVTIPEGVTSIGQEAFYGCSGLTSITIPSSVTSIGNDAFSNCSGLTSITIGGSVTSIGSGAFSNCSGLTSVTIPEGVTSIGYGAFDGCSGLSYNTYDNAKYLGNESNPYSVLMGSASTSITQCNIHPETKFIYNSAFSNCSELTSVTIPDSVTSIGYYAFSNCSGLTSVTIGSGVTAIGFQAFYSCGRLHNIYYNGTMAQLDAISKDSSWTDPAYTIHCTDGDIAK